MTSRVPAGQMEEDRENGPMFLSWELHRCANPACRRKVGGSSRYCCGICHLAHVDKWDIDGEHTAPCNQRAAERGEWALT